MQTIEPLGPVTVLRASLREDYLNQVQRDFLSVGLIPQTSAPPATCLGKRSDYGRSPIHWTWPRWLAK